MLIVGGDVVTCEETKRANIAVSGGKVAAVMPPSERPSAKHVIDATGRHILPGLVDVHFHIRAPAYPERATVASETRAAAAGGVTTLFEMPISKPCCSTADVVRMRRAHFEREAHVDFALFGAPGRLDRDEIAEMCAAGVIAFKVFMTEAPAGREDEFEGLSVPDEAALLEAQKLVAESGRVLFVHAESSALLKHFAGTIAAADRAQPLSHPASRPDVVEATAIAGFCALGLSTGARLHIAHVSSKRGADVVGAFQALGVDVTAETCPHYLLFTEDEAACHGAFAKINPPIRAAADRDALWAAIGDGRITIVSTDHAPFSLREKESAGDDIIAAPPGAPGAEFLLLTALSGVAEGHIRLEDAVALVSANGAKRFGLYPRKGTIREGADADLVVVDLTATTTVDAGALKTDARACAQLYAGRTFPGRIDTTLLRGTVIYDQGEIVGRPGYGRYVQPNG